MSLLAQAIAKHCRHATSTSILRQIYAYIYLNASLTLDITSIPVFPPHNTIHSAAYLLKMQEHSVRQCQKTVLSIINQSEYSAECFRCIILYVKYNILYKSRAFTSYHTWYKMYRVTLEVIRRNLHTERYLKTIVFQ